MLSIPFAPAQSANTDCGELHYSIVGASSPLVTIDSDNGKVNVYGRYKSDVTTVEPIVFSIRACHRNIQYWDDINCSRSQEISVYMEDSCENTDLNFSVDRLLTAPLDGVDTYTIDGPFDSVDLATADEGYRKCGGVMCSASFSSDPTVQPAFIQVANQVYDSITGTYNTDIRLMPVAGRDAPGVYSIMINCELEDYPQRGIFSTEL